jgi:hypothetical protein
LWAKRDQPEEDVVFHIRSDEIRFLTTDDTDYFKTDFDADLDLDCTGAAGRQDGWVCGVSWADRADA